MSYYSARLAEYGCDVRALGWGSVESQTVRFKVLSEISFVGERVIVLDFGCGFGDLYGYLKRFVNVEYIGYDNDPEILALARKKYPDAQFIDEPVEADYVLESGVFNLNPNWHSDVQRLWSLCRKGLALNFTSSLAAARTPGIVYADPFETARFCSNLTRNFILRHDYKPNDFTLYLYK